MTEADRGEASVQRPTDVRGLYSPAYGRRIVVETPQDLVDAGLGVNIEGVRRAWGEEGVRIYAQGMTAKGLGRVIPPDLRPSTDTPKA